MQQTVNCVKRLTAQWKKHSIAIVIAIAVALYGLGSATTYAAHTIFDCPGGVTSSAYHNKAYFFITTDIHYLSSCIAHTDVNLHLSSLKPLPFLGLAIGVYGNDILAAGIQDDDDANKTSVGFYKQDGNTLQFSKVYEKEAGKMLAIANATDFGIVLAYAKEFDSGNTYLAVYQAGNNRVVTAKDPIPAEIWLGSNGIIPLTSSGSFFITTRLTEEKKPTILHYDMNCTLLGTKSLHELVPNLPKLERFAGRMLSPNTVLFWGLTEPALWWLGVYDVKKGTITQTATVTPGIGVMPELIYDAVQLPNGKICIATPSTLFLLDTQLRIQKEWVAPQEMAAGLEMLTLTPDGRLLVQGSSGPERTGKAAVWLVNPNEFTPFAAPATPQAE